MGYFKICVPLLIVLLPLKHENSSTKKKKKKGIAVRAKRQGSDSVSSVQSLSPVRLFATLWTAARQASLSITNCWSLLKLMSIELAMPSNYLILCHPISSCLQSFPTSGSFQRSQFFASGGQLLEFQLQHQSFQKIFRTDFL